MEVAPTVRFARPSSDEAHPVHVRSEAARCLGIAGWVPARRRSPAQVRATPKKTLREWVAAYQAEQAADPPLVAAPSTAEAGAPVALAAQLRQAQWQIEALYTLIDQAEAAYKIDIRKKGRAKPSK